MPTSAVPIAHTTVSGASATANLRFGLRTSSTQTAGSLLAPISFSVVAP